MYANFTDKFDWYMKADDDSFIIMENLKHMLRQLNPNQPVYLGGRSMTLLKNGYNGGGAGKHSRGIPRCGCRGRPPPTPNFEA